LAVLVTARVQRIAAVIKSYGRVVLVIVCFQLLSGCFFSADFCSLTRAKPGCIVRSKECRHCGQRMITRERAGAG
jgi:hypothetical protein